MKVAGLCLLAILGLANASPVEQVVNLLSKMKDTLIADGKHEQQIYDKYACWCETTAKRKASDINQGDADLRSLGQSILTLKGQVATLTAEMEELTSEIKENQEAQAEATAEREKEHTSFSGMSDETSQALAALQSAIKVLADATMLAQTSNGKTALIQGAQHLRMKSAVSDVLSKIPMRLDFPSSKVALLAEFTSAKSTYAPQSATIQGMLGDMYTTFAANLEEATQTEATQQFEFEDYMAETTDLINKKEALKTKKAGEKADAEKALADDTKAYDMTEEQKAEDIEFFDQTKKACEDKNEEWELRVKNRDSELDGIKKALEILTSDAAREMFAKAIKPGVESFLQVQSDADTSASNRAYLAIRTQVRKTRSVRLAALAVQVRNAKAGHFDKVIGAIDGVIQDLKDEEAADIAKKDECKENYQEIATTVADLEWEIKKSKAKIAKLEASIAKDKESRQAALDKKTETKEYMADITKTRKATFEAFKVAQSDDDAAIKLLEAARDALAAYYKKEGIDMGEIQGSVKLMQEPEFAVSQDQAPDASFSNKGGHKLESKNILSIMAYLIEDLYDEIAADKKSEAESLTDYQEEMKSAQDLCDKLDEEMDTLTDNISDSEDDKTSEHKTKKGTEKDRDSELAYKAKIKPDCDWIISSFTERADARAAEMNGLVTAKEFLAGQASFAQQPSKFDDSTLRSIKFLGFSH